MMDQITIKDLEVYANHGLYKEEKALGQKFLVSVILSFDTKLAGVSDQMDYSVDYGKVCHRIKEILTENDFNLIECVAETVAKKLLLEFSLIRKLEIEVKKPWAPIGLPLDYVSVKIKRGWHRAYLGVGSNMGDRMEYINQAINAIEAQDDTRVVHVSSLIETKPYGGVVQDDFLNGCIAIDTLKEPEAYEIDKADTAYGTIQTDSTQIKTAAENIQQALYAFSYEKLNVKNKITYDLLKQYLRSLREEADYLYYEEPLNTVNGVQTQIPIVLSEYQFYDRTDVEAYLDVLSETRDYFQQIIAFEREKADKGLFLSDEMADQVLEQCNAFLAMGNGNYLYSTFVSRIGELQELSEKEKSDYIQQNARQMEEQVYPAYEDLIQAVKELKGKGTNEKGLCYFPEGRKYYEWYIQQSVGVTDTIQELEQLTRRQISEDITGMEEAVNEAKQAAAILENGKAERILEKLKKGIGTAFPEIPKTSLQIKYVPEEMQEHLSPAFYMIPAIDYTEENVIYVNQIQMRDDLTLFTTLAHEGYPGHLYQTIFFESTNPDPIRSILNFGGYVEGWATYAEMCSYYLMPLSKTQAAILQKNSSVILALYALADMGIHYEGWSRMDTVEFYARYGIKDAETVDKIYNLILGSPGNYLKYYIGYVKFLELKKEWIKSGNQSQKEFHKAVLSVGPAPFEIVGKYFSL